MLKVLSSYTAGLACGIHQTEHYMARQHGPTKLEGKLGDISFYITKYGALARTIGAVSKERFHNDPKLARRKAAAFDFGYVSTTGKLLRQEIAKCIAFAAEGSTNQRLNA